MASDFGDSRVSNNRLFTRELNSIFLKDLQPLFWTPARLDMPSAWWGHVPFAFWLIAVCKPRLLVELGTQHGVSYAAFCEAVSRSRLDAKVYAVDTWKGDPQAGFYGDQVYHELKAFSDANYAPFSELLRMTFDEAGLRFSDSAIDILHIDGYHSYEAVRHDFEQWRPKLSERGVILFHDTNVRRDDFGVWRFFEELAETTPCFSFRHSEGLGVAAVGPEAPEPVKDLCSLENESDAERIRAIFAQMGSVWTGANSLLQERRGNQARIEELERKLAEREHELRRLRPEYPKTRPDAETRPDDSGDSSDRACFPQKVLAHVANVGDTGLRPDGWAGRRGSGLAIEGFAIAIGDNLVAAGFSYQSVTAAGALSDAVAAGHYCGTRDKAVPIFGLRLRLDDDAADRFHVTYEAQFVDGSRVGPLRAPLVCCAPSNAPLEAFRVRFSPIQATGDRMDADRARSDK